MFMYLNPFDAKYKYISFLFFKKKIQCVQYSFQKECEKIIIIIITFFFVFIFVSHRVSRVSFIEGNFDHQMLSREL